MEKKSKLVAVVAFLLVVNLLLSCGNGGYTPKPRGYFRIDLPEKSYTHFDSVGYPYSFEIPVYGKINAKQKDGEKYWVDLYFPYYNATVYISYKPVAGNLAELIEDTHKLSYQHSVRAEAITDTPYINDSLKVYGLLTEIAGEAASPVQFYLTDSVKNFLRGSLYFYSAPNRDSLNPLIDYFKEDIMYLMETVEWKTK